jgi:hypothetical protein
MRWSIEELIKYWGYYSERNLRMWLRYFFNNRKRRFKLFWRWIFTGYCRESLWSLDDYFSELILFRLKKFRGVKKFGYPSEMSGIEEWNEKLEALIQKFQILIDRSIENKVVLDKAGFHKEIEVKDKKVMAWTSGQTEEEHKQTIELFEAQSKNDSEAIELFRELYFDLWD